MSTGKGIIKVIAQLTVLEEEVGYGDLQSYLSSFFFQFERFSNREDKY